MDTIKLQQRGTLTLPKKIRESLNLSEGDVLTITENKNTIVIERADLSDSELLKDIKNSLSEIKNGKYIEFGSITEFKKKLKKYDAD